MRNPGGLQTGECHDQIYISGRLMRQQSGNRGFLGGTVLKHAPANAADAGDAGLISGSGKIPWRRKWQPTPVFLPGESHRQRNWWATVHGVEKSWSRLN